MHLRTLVIERDDPDAPGLLIRRYARVRVCWEPELNNWGWMLLDSAGAPAGPVAGPFPAGDSAFEDAQAKLGGAWEGPPEEVPGTE